MKAININRNTIKSFLNTAVDKSADVLNAVKKGSDVTVKELKTKWNQPKTIEELRAELNKWQEKLDAQLKSENH